MSFKLGIYLGLLSLHIQSKFELCGPYRSENTFLKIFVLPAKGAGKTE